MAVVMSMHWPEITKDHYERALKGVRWEQNRPKGALFSRRLVCSPTASVSRTSGDQPGPFSGSASSA